MLGTNNFNRDLRGAIVDKGANAIKWSNDVTIIPFK